MINLIPNEEKKEMKRGFYFRVIILFLIIGSFSFLIASVAILPAYFLSSIKRDFVTDKLEMQKKEPVPLPEEQTIAVIKDVDNKLKVIENVSSNKFTISQKVIDAIIANKASSVKITNISYENNNLKGKKISIQGTAPSREILLLFRLALENDVQFEQVDLPISNFVKGSNIQFYLSLIPRQNDD